MSMPAALEWPEAESRTAETARTRRGHHRDHALASYRRARAVELRTQGSSYAEIARELGYANRGTAHRVVSQALQAREIEDVDFLRSMELERLDALSAALWARAMAGDLQAVLGVLRIIEARWRMLGLSTEEKVKGPAARWDNCQGPSTVVIRADDCRRDGCPQHGKLDM